MKADNLRKQREKLGLTQAKLAISSGVKESVIDGLEQGKKDINKTDAMIVYRLAQALRCSVEELLQFEE